MANQLELRFSRKSARRLTCAAAVLAFRSAYGAGGMPVMASTVPVIPESIDARTHAVIRQDDNGNRITVEIKSSDHANPAALNTIARSALEQGDLPQAMQALEASIKGDASNSHLLQQLSLLQERIGATGQAEQSLRAAISVANDRNLSTQLKERLATLLFDTSRPTEGIAVLNDVANSGPGVASQIAVIAYFEGQYIASARYFAQADTTNSASLQLLAGNAALRAGKPVAAINAFKNAFAHASHAEDRLYAQERFIAASRQAGTIQQLEDEWLVQTNLLPEQMFALATMLRESGRVPQLLEWWTHQAARPEYADTVLSTKFTGEIVGAAQEAGLLPDAEKIARNLLSQNPDSAQEFSLLLNVLLRQQKVAEAASLLSSRITASAQLPEKLDRLGRLAKSLGLDNPAIQAAHALQQLGSDNAISGMLLESSILISAGEIDQGTAILRTAATMASTHTGAVAQVATALESAGLTTDAIQLLQSSADQTHDETTLETLAVLLKGQNRYPEAVSVLQILRHTASTPALRSQSSQRLIDVALAGHTIDPLIDHSRASFDSGLADESEISLLVDAYVRTGKPESAIDVLTRAKTIEPVIRLNRLALLYLRLHKLSEAASVLRELVTVDPDNAISTLEQLASTELDLKKPRDAAAVIDEISQRAAKNSAIPSELMGGVFDRLNQPVQAAACYRKALIEQPENADEWLLWSTATAKAGASGQAIQRLELLGSEADSEDLFAVAVDGLLNLHAPPQAISTIRRDAILRAAASPDKVMLFHVIGDLSDELQDTHMVERAIDISVAMNWEERPQRLRELMEYAISKGSLEEATACAESILALGDDFTPQIFLQLAEQLLIAGRPADAERAVSRAMDVSRDDVITPRAAVLFEQYGFPRQALDMLSSLALRKRNDLSIQKSLARLNELSGKYTAAFDNAMAAIAVLGEHLSAGTDSNGKAVLATPNPPADLTQLVDSAVSMARTPLQQTALLDALEALAASLMPEKSTVNKPPMDVLQIATTLRRADFELNHFDRADRVDQLILNRWPAEETFRNIALTDRIAYGLYPCALRFASINALNDQLPASLKWFAPNAATTATTVVPAEQAEFALPWLITHGRLEDARQILLKQPVVLPQKPAETIPVLIVAAIALDNSDVATKWTLLWLDSEIRNASPINKNARPSGQPSAIVTRVWRVLPRVTQRRVLDRLIEVSKTDSDIGRSTAASILTLQLAADQGIELPDALTTASKLAKNPRALGYLSLPNSSGAASLINLLPVADRPDFVRQAIKQSPPEFQLLNLQRMIEQAIEPFDDQTNAAIIEQANAIHTKQLGWTYWFTGTVHAAVFPAIADAVLRNAADTGQVQDQLTDAQVSAAVALHASDPARADTLALAAIEQIRSIPQGVLPKVAHPEAVAEMFGRNRLTMLHYALGALSPKGRESLLNTIQSAPAGMESSTANRAWQSLVYSFVLDSAGHRTDGLVALRQAYEFEKNNALTRTALAERLRNDGRLAELVDTFLMRLPPIDYPLRDSVTYALHQLYRSREVPAAPEVVGASAFVEPPLLDFMTPLANQQQDKLAETFRIMLQRQRTNANVLPIVNEAAHGGLPLPADANYAIPETFRKMNAWPGSVDDLLATIRVLPPNSPFADELAEMFAQSSNDVSKVQTVIQTLNTCAIEGTLTTNDRLLILHLSMVPDLKLPTPLVDELWNLARENPTGAADTQLLKSLIAQGDSRAADVARWATLCSQLGQSSRADMSVRNQLHPLPSPVDHIEDPVMSDWLKSLLGAGKLEQAESELSKLRATGRVSQDHVRCQLLWARIAIEHNDVQACGVQLVAALDAVGSQPQRLSSPTDILLSLPQKIQDPGVRNQVSVTVLNAVQQAAVRWPENTNWMCMLCSIGDWELNNGDPDQAAKLLDVADRIAQIQGPCVQQLWIADLAAKLGQTDRSIRIQRSLLESDCLPSARVYTLLNQLEIIGDHKTALQLARRAGKYCCEPRLQVGLASGIWQ